eukprot:m.54964 g.54964  ORF g.54964 m.54964 type:complete len:191 (+) comp34436_c0_seq3:23-595(+)
MDDTKDVADELCRFYIAHVLQKKGFKDAVPSKMLQKSRQPSAGAVFDRLRELADAFEEHNPKAFEEMSAALNINAVTVYANFVEIASDLFVDGIRWGRVVALYAFSGCLAVECVKRDLRNYVGSVSGWSSEFMTENLVEWIRANGGWEGFLKYYSKRGTQDAHDAILWRRVGWGALAAGGLALAAWVMGK